MRERLYNMFSRIYGITMSIAFWGGLLPLVPFAAAVCIGGTAGEETASFLYNQYYPVIIALASIAVIIGLAGMYLGGKEAFSTKSLGKKDRE